MGVPELHYKSALQAMAHALAFEVEDYKLASELVEEQDDERLEEYILHMKEKITSKIFYFLAGRALEWAAHEADGMGIDAFNAAVCGLTSFEDFIMEKGEK